MSSLVLLKTTDPHIARLEGFIKPRARHYEHTRLSGHPGHSLILWAADRAETAMHLPMEGDAFIAIAGTFFYGDKMGEDAARAFHADFDAATFNWAGCTGQFTIALSKGGCLHVFSDGLAAWKHYTNAARSFVSAGFLEALLLDPAPSFNAQGLYEYAHAGYVLGPETFVAGIEAVLPNRMLTLGPDGSFTERTLPTPIRPGPRRDLDPEALADFQLGVLRQRFAHLAALKPDDIASSISGGFDSRMMVGLFHELGLRPKLFVYGPESDPDVPCSRAVAAYLGLELTHIDRSKLPPVREEDIPEAQDLLFYFDGWKDDGLVGYRRGISDRRDRVAGARFMANGKCGEIYRQFYYQRIGPGGADFSAMVRATFGRHVPQVVPAGFDGRAFCASIERRLRKITGFEDKRLQQQDLEYWYPRVRICHDAGRDIAINHRFAQNLYPFVEPELCGPALMLTYDERRFGRLQGRMLAHLDAGLAALPSAYGFDLTEGPSALYRLKDTLSSRRPMWLRVAVPWLKQVLRRGGAPILPEYSLLEDRAMPYMRRYFRLDNIRDAQMASRLCGMELLAQTFNFKG